jgi:hypothetical protein
MKIFSILTRSLLPQARLHSEDEKADWLRDPLSHPELENMSARELADLPFDRGYPYRSGAQPCCS